MSIENRLSRPPGPRHRIGVTMRVAQMPDTGEARDSLAQDWGRFLAFAVPEVSWLPVPNLGAGVVSFAQRWRLDALILTGGEDPGASPSRDETEAALLDHFLDRGAPVLGVCRGLQLLNKRFGGSLQRCEPEGAHAGSRHLVALSDDGAEDRFEVNSYHHLGIPAGGLAAPLEPLAATLGGWVEAACLPSRPVAAVMWHPEREQPFDGRDRALARALFGY